MSDLATIREGWDQAACEDAMGNIITIPGLTPDEFWERGRSEIDAMVKHLDKVGLRGDKRDHALDFGCGVGRLTQALAGEYKYVTGADVSGEMVLRARELNRYGGRVGYINTGASLLDSFAPNTFDLIYSRITLQHMPADLQRGYVEEFVELLAPDGLAVFQIPDGPDYEHPNDWLSMYGVPRQTVQDWIADTGGKLLDVELLEDASPTWLAYRYTVRA